MKKSLTLAISATMLMAGGDALAKDNQPPKPKGGRTKIGETENVNESDVTAARVAFENALDIYASGAGAEESKAKIMKFLDEEVSKMKTPQKKKEVIDVLRNKIDKKITQKSKKSKSNATEGAEKEQTGENSVTFESEKISGRVSVVEKPGGGDRLIFEANAFVSLKDFIAEGILKPNYWEFTRSQKKDSPVLRDRIESKVKTLYILVEAKKAAESQGKKELAEKIKKNITIQKTMIQKAYGDILV